VGAARRQGIALLMDRRCIAPGVVAQASNILVYEDDLAHVDIEREQGRVTCLLRRTTDPTASEVREAKATVTTQLRYRNVECWVTPLPDSNQSQVAALRAAFEELSERF
jgi:hypothetical protein